MAIPNPNWPRWLFASVADFFKTKLDGINVPLLVEGVDEREAETIRAVDHVEFRFHGPEVQEVSKDYFKLAVEINLLVSQIMGLEQQNAYSIVQTCGVLQQSASGSIPIYRHGDGQDDDGELLGCLRPDPGRNEAVTVYHFGQIDKDTRIRQSAVDGRFLLYLTL